MDIMITQNKAARLERNAKIKELYNKELQAGGMKSAIIAEIAKNYKLTIPTVYSIIK
jgi:hypothetical protein